MGMKSKWHPVVIESNWPRQGKTVGLPEKAGDYLVTWFNRKIEIAHFTKRKGFYDDKRQIGVDVTYWRELPPLPRKRDPRN